MLLSMKSTLDICIPTYNRSESLRATLEGLEWVRRYQNINVVVLDNASPDNTVEIVKAHSDWVRLELGESNVGLGMNVIQCFSKSDAMFTLVLSDEDDLDEASTIRALSFAEKRQVDFLSPLALNREKNWYVRGSQSRRIRSNEVMDSSFLLSGLIFRTEAARGTIDHYLNLFPENRVWQIYPQSVLALHAILQRKAWFLKRVVVRERDRNIGAHELGENHYDTVNMRHLEFKGLLELAMEMCNDAGKTEAFCHRVCSSLANRHLNVLINSISQEVPFLNISIFQAVAWKISLTFRRIAPQAGGMMFKRLWQIARNQTAGE